MRANHDGAAFDRIGSTGGTPADARGRYPTYAIGYARGLGERRIPVLQNVPQFAHRADSCAAQDGT
jgi:hypothetical protein